MSKLMLFILLTWLIGNPWIAVIILLAVLYFIDRRFIGVFPSISIPYKRYRNISKLRQQLSLSPFDVSAKRELARLLLERKKYKEALALLEEVRDYSESSAEYWDDLGRATIGLGRLDEGEAMILQAIRLNERVRYGQPYLTLALAFKEANPEKALAYVGKYGEIQSSSSEACYLLGSLYRSLGRKEEANQAFQESIAVYRSLPKFKKRHERKWAVRSYFSSLFV
ncbi:tetratricopeptide repeat protein [Paenibacillus sp. alder61]|uniref:tetratricopeptide repeat protein n=1 Tax=Paenibacillus sp. alder61 TaxID=2862948 RepID=UPI001CD624BF|nr:tetratricopeptide repeat protein [Paenibacillus sp. alder61]MCA1294280.1 tetratricopeptide repeat protein [Paenibacillus sp. alder61]